MKPQIYTPEEAQLKQTIETLADHLQPEGDFVTQLESRLMQHEALASTQAVTQAIKPAAPPRRRPRFWQAFRLVATAAMVMAVVGGYLMWPHPNRPETPPTAVSQRPTSTLDSAYPATWTPETRDVVEATPTLALLMAPTLPPPPTATPVVIRLNNISRPDSEDFDPLGDFDTVEFEGNFDGFESISAAEIDEVNHRDNLQYDNTNLPPADMTFQDYGTNPFLNTADDNLSTFGLDVDTASYSLARSYLRDVGQLPPAEAIRSEEFVNYFEADYAGPPESEDGAAFAIHVEAAPAPFGFADHYLMRIGLQGRYIPPEARDPALLIFVIDVSGSMDRGNRLGLVKQSLEILVENLSAQDRVGIVVYSDNSRVLLEPTSASHRSTLLNAINRLQTEGSTNVDAGLRLGYQLAQTHQQAEQISRLIVLSDGVANVDTTSPDGILRNIQAGVDEGITLSMIGFGMGNYNDVLMEQLANKGNGNYYYIDTLRQARRVFVYNLTSMLQLIGYDAKIQVEFNPTVADRFRQIGYENRAIAHEDFRNDRVDAGEVGAGHSVTALYELALHEDAFAADEGIATVYVRYHDADSRQVVELSRTLTVGQVVGRIEAAPPTFRLHAAAAEFAELLGERYWARAGSYQTLLTFAQQIESDLPNHEPLLELIDLIGLAASYASEQPPTQTPPIIQITPPMATEFELAVRHVGQLDREQVTLLNRGPAINLNGWTLEGSPLGIFQFPSMTLGRDGTVRLFTHVGQSRGETLYLNQAQAALQPGLTLILRDASGQEQARLTVQADLPPPPPLPRPEPNGRGFRTPEGEIPTATPTRTIGPFGDGQSQPSTPEPPETEFIEIDPKVDRNSTYEIIITRGKTGKRVVLFVPAWVSKEAEQKIIEEYVHEEEGDSYFVGAPRPGGPPEFDEGE